MSDIGLSRLDAVQAPRGLRPSCIPYTARVRKRSFRKTLNVSSAKGEGCTASVRSKRAKVKSNGITFYKKCAKRESPRLMIFVRPTVLFFLNYRSGSLVGAFSRPAVFQCPNKNEGKKAHCKYAGKTKDKLQCCSVEKYHGVRLRSVLTGE